MQGEQQIKVLPQRQSKTIAQNKIMTRDTTKTKKPKLRTSPRQTDLDKKYERISFEPLEFNTFKDFSKLVRENYLADLQCVQFDKFCINNNLTSNLWCINLNCKGVEEEFVQKHIEKLWHVHEAGLRREKPSVFVGWAEDESKSPKKMQNQPVPLKKKNIHWCYVCGYVKRLINCEKCTASYHKVCQSPKKIVNDGCPQCKINCQVSTDGIVWHKMGRYPWWPARLIQLKMRPKCLIKPPSVFHSPVKYFGTNNFAFVDVRELCKFQIEHNPEIHNKSNKGLLKAFQEACEAYEKEANYKLN